MEICIDIETLSTKKNAHILSIGAIAFDVITDLEDGVSNYDNTKFFMPVSSHQPGRAIDVDTVEWWLQQSKVAQDALGPGGKEPLASVLNILALWINKNGGYNTHIWANSPSFDCDILVHAYENSDAREHCPWKYYQERDVRTAKQLVGEPEFQGTKHVALDDAIHEARIVQRYLKLKDLL